MVTEYPPVRLKSDEQAQLFKVVAPEPEWKERLLTRLSHKGPLWDKPMNDALEGGLEGMTMYFFQLRLDDVAVGNLTIVEALKRPIALLQHVFTDPNHRRKGICSIMMQAMVDDFRSRDGRAMYLGTGYDTPPYHIYRSFGFEGIGTTGAMVWALDDDYPESYFPGGPVQVRPMRWGDWAPLTALYQQIEGWDLRSYSFNQFGHSSYESAFCRLQEVIEEGRAARATVLEDTTTGAVVGHAFTMQDEKWPGGPEVLECFVHPRYQHNAAELLDAIALPADARLRAYADAEAAGKLDALQRLGFVQKAVLEMQYVRKDGRPANLVILSRG